MRWTFTLMAICGGCAAQGDLVFAKELIDFGPALPGVERSEPVELINKSNATVVLAGGLTTNPDFRLDFPPRMTFSPQQRRTFTLRHTPPIDASDAQLADLQVWTDDGIVAALHASSLPASPDCTLPEQLDFGPLSIGETAMLELPLNNTTGWPSGALVEVPLVTHQAFELTPGWVPLAAGEEVKLPITFTPNEARVFTAALPIRQHPLCPVQLVRLQGEGSNEVFSVQPLALEWSVEVGHTEVQAVTLINRRLTPVTLSNVQVRDGELENSVFHATRIPLRVPGAQRDAFNRIVPGVGTLEVSFSPQSASFHSALLTMETDLPMRPTMLINLRGSGMQ